MDHPIVAYIIGLVQSNKGLAPITHVYCFKNSITSYTLALSFLLHHTIIHIVQSAIDKLQTKSGLITLHPRATGIGQPNKYPMIYEHIRLHPSTHINWRNNWKLVYWRSRFVTYSECEWNLFKFLYALNTHKKYHWNK